ncbi:hypothetical protein A0H81_12323 [Grifola frondosa]|uniref:Uncharacterized protein n=1 Tax=Grifola frondosa TaxID=5627 RepID=A0A1C7LUX6_GRIFR|nr:hypothetical protein A0H81_12323 [Grifola frondosa]
MTPPMSAKNIWFLSKWQTVGSSADHSAFLNSDEWAYYGLRGAFGSRPHIPHESSRVSQVSARSHPFPSLTILRPTLIAVSTTSEGAKVLLDDCTPRSIKVQVVQLAAATVLLAIATCYRQTLCHLQQSIHPNALDFHRKLLEKYGTVFTLSENIVLKQQDLFEKSPLFVKRLNQYVPPWIPLQLRRKIFNIIPHKGFWKLQSVADTLHSHSVDIFLEKKTALEKGDDAVLHQVGESKGIISILLRANMQASGEDRLPEEEVIAQVS